MSRTVVVLVGTGLVFAGCASKGPTMRERLDAVAGPREAMRAPPAMKTTGDMAVDKANALHRQYYDKRKRRYYFFDPARKQYFWETGEPKA